MWRAALCLSAVAAVVASPSAQAASGDTEQTLGAQFEIRMDDLPRPNSTQSVLNFPKTVDRLPTDRLLVPEGFTAKLFASIGLEHPRHMVLAPNGDVFLAEPNAGRITILRDSDKDGIAEARFVFAEGLVRPYGMSFYRKGLIIADTRALWHFDYEVGQIQAGERLPLTRPGALGSAKGHWTRNMILSADEAYAYVAIGSLSNLAEEDAPRATIQKIRLKDGKRMTYASGLRNPIGMAFHPTTEDLYTLVNERDRMGDRSVPDYMTKVLSEEFYGWPYAYIGANPDPLFGDKDPERVKATRLPEVLFESHSAPIDLVFYDGQAFPEDYRGDAFVSFRGSWNSTRPKGYKIVRVHFQSGQPVGTYENFAVGFWRSGANRAKVWGRPTGLLVASDGALLVADDVGKTIWRISFTHP